LVTPTNPLRIDAGIKPLGCGDLTRDGPPINIVGNRVPIAIQR
jgi:hypothetical protein